MIWHYINTGENKGSFNMEFDLDLVKATGPDNTVLRLYRWHPYCISLGANQSMSEINLTKAENDGIDVVKRPTGGRAILHSEELTYSVIMPLNRNHTPRQMYEQINLALIEGLKIYDTGLTGLELESTQPDLGSFYRENISAACFSVPAKSEIKYNGKKIVGSAQRKIGSALLQHGSIMCGNFHVNLADYLEQERNDVQKIKDDLKNRTIELETVLNKKTDYSMLAEAVVAGFEKFFAVNMVREEIFIK